MLGLLPPHPQKILRGKTANKSTAAQRDILMFFSEISWKTGH